jgi:hypothetical protein
MAPGQHSSVLCIGSSSIAQPGIQRRTIQYVHIVKMHHHKNEGIQSIQVPQQKPRINTFWDFVKCYLNVMDSMLQQLLMMGAY